MCDWMFWPHLQASLGFVQLICYLADFVDFHLQFLDQIFFFFLHSVFSKKTTQYLSFANSPYKFVVWCCFPCWPVFQRSQGLLPSILHDSHHIWEYFIHFLPLCIQIHLEEMIRPFNNTTRPQHILNHYIYECTVTHHCSFCRCCDLSYLFLSHLNAVLQSFPNFVFGYLQWWQKGT